MTIERGILYFKLLFFCITRHTLMQVYKWGTHLIKPFELSYKSTDNAKVSIKNDLCQLYYNYDG